MDAKKNMSLAYIAQNFIERMMEMGHPEAWESPYILKAGTGYGFYNFVTGTEYRGGLNAFLLLWGGSQFYTGAGQAAKAGIKFKEGQKPHPNYIYRPLTVPYKYKDAKTGEEKTGKNFVGFGYAIVYPITDFDVDVDEIKCKLGLDTPAVASEDEEVAKYEELEKLVIDKLGIPVVHNNQTVASSAVGRLRINMPYIRNMKSPAVAITTLLHEVGHAMAQKGGTHGNSYGLEEANAETFSVLSASAWGYDADVTNAIAYLWHWLGIREGMFEGRRKFQDLTAEEKTVVNMVRDAFEEATKRLRLANKELAEEEEGQEE